jgi:hypothetical protein
VFFRSGIANAFFYYQNQFMTEMQSSVNKKLVVVLGATGGQGNSVIDAFLKDDEYTVRGVTRQTHSAKAQALTKRGVEMVVGDVHDEKSLAQAFVGAFAIFAMTNFFEPFVKVGPEMAMDIEFEQGRNIARAASSIPTLQHFLWSTLPNAKELTQGKFVVPHVEAKNRIDNFIKQDKNLLAKTTFLWFGFYAENMFYPVFTPIHVVSVFQIMIVSWIPRPIAIAEKCPKVHSTVARRSFDADMVPRRSSY